MQRALGKQVEGSEKRTRKLLAGYERIIRGRVEEINGLLGELGRRRRERAAVEQLEEQEKGSMQARIG